MTAAGFALAAASATAYARTHPGTSHGLYWDAARDWSLENWPTIEQELGRIGIDHIVVPLNGHEHAIAGRAAVRWLPEHVATLIRKARSIRVDVMIWAAPTAEFVADARRVLPRLKRAGVSIVEFDAERDAWGVVPVGTTRAAAALALLDAARSAGLNAGVTMIPERIYPEWASADYCAVQSYSRANGGLANHSGDGPYAPGNMQRLGARRVQQAGMPLVQALAAYDQRWPGTPVVEPMRRAYEAAASSSRVVRWWSAKWVVGHRAQADVRAAIAMLTQRG